jgi:hypothetical protein
MGQQPDGDAPGTPARSITSAHAKPLPGRLLWRDRSFRTLAAAMALSLFAQAGLITHLYSLLVSALSAQGAGLAMALATACAIGGRTVVGKFMPANADRRVVASVSYAVQIVGSLLLACAAEHQTALILRAWCCSVSASATRPRCRRWWRRWSSSRKMCRAWWR